MSTNYDRRTRLVALTLLLVTVLPLSVVAARWQWSRHLEREGRNQLITANIDQPAVDYRTLTDSALIPDPSFEWRSVQAAGEFETGNSRLWRRQTVEGRPGFIALSILRTADGDRVLVARGFAPADGQNAAPGYEVSPPSGPVNLTGRLRPLNPEVEADPADMPAGQTNSPATLLTEDMPSAYIEVTGIEPAQDLVFLPAPAIESGPHLGYVGQWILIGCTSVVAYVIIIRRTRLPEPDQASETRSA